MSKLEEIWEKMKALVFLVAATEIKVKGEDKMQDWSGHDVLEILASPSVSKVEPPLDLQDQAPVRVTISQSSNSQGSSLFLQEHLSSRTDFSKRTNMTNMSKAQNTLFPLKLSHRPESLHSTHWSSITKSKSDEQHSGANTTAIFYTADGRR